MQQNILDIADKFDRFIRTQLESGELILSGTDTSLRQVRLGDQQLMSKDEKLSYYAKFFEIERLNEKQKQRSTLRPQKKVDIKTRIEEQVKKEAEIESF